MADVQYEWGKLNVGQPYLITAIDVDRAIAHYRWHGYEFPILQHIREKSWGSSVRRKRRKDPWPDAVPFRPNLYALADEWGVDYERLKKDRRSLLRLNVLKEEGTALSINKFAHEWEPSRWATPRGLSFAASAQSRKKGGPRTPRSGYQDTPTGGYQDIPSRDTTVPLVGIPQYPHSGYHSIPTHIEERARKDPTGLESKKSVLSEHTQDAVACEDRDGNLAPPEGGAANSEADMKALADLAEELFPMLSFDRTVLDYRRVWPATWIRLALIDARAWSSPPRSFAPIKNLLQRWAREGGPPEPKAAPAPNGNGHASRAEERRAAFDRDLPDWSPPSRRKTP